MTTLSQRNDSSYNQEMLSQHQADLEERLEALLQDLVARKDIHHAIMAIETLEGAHQWTGVAGDAHPGGPPMHPETPFFIASVTKLYIATVIWKLHERGEVDVAAPMSEYLPASLVAGLHRLDGTDYTSRITLKHLLGHSSGLPDFLEERPEGGKSLFDLLVEEGDRTWTIEEAMELVREEFTPYFPPQPFDTKRQKIRYSDTNYQLLIAIIEAVTGGMLHAAFEEHLYRPLGLEQTFHPGVDPLRPAPEPATLWAGEKPLEIPQALRSFGDLYSTASDTLTFMRALVEGTVFDDPQTATLMQQNWNRFGFSLNLAPITPGWPIEYSLGMMRFRIPRIFSPLRPTPEVIGHTGVTGSWLFYAPEFDLLLSGTVDQASAAAVPFRFVPKLLRLLARRVR